MAWKWPARYRKFRGALFESNGTCTLAAAEKLASYWDERGHVVIIVRWNEKQHLNEYVVYHREMRK
jgi:hypothetical protein